jgi:hypothetical protein
MSKMKEPKESEALKENPAMEIEGAEGIQAPETVEDLPVVKSKKIVPPVGTGRVDSSVAESKKIVPPVGTGR